MQPYFDKFKNCYIFYVTPYVEIYRKYVKNNLLKCHYIQIVKQNKFKEKFWTRNHTLFLKITLYFSLTRRCSLLSVMSTYLLSCTPWRNFWSDVSEIFLTFRLVNNELVPAHIKMNVYVQKLNCLWLLILQLIKMTNRMNLNKAVFWLDWRHSK